MDFCLISKAFLFNKQPKHQELHIETATTSGYYQELHFKETYSICCKIIKLKRPTQKHVNEQGLYNPHEHASVFIHICTALLYFPADIQGFKTLPCEVK